MNQVSHNQADSGQLSSGMIKIWRYGHYDGIPTFRDSEIMGMYAQMKMDGTVDTVFHDGIIRSREDFLRFVSDPGTIMAVATIDGVPVGIGWLTHLEKRCARVHFCLFTNGWGARSVEIGTTLVEHLVNLKSADTGEHLFDVLIGYTPSSNRLAVDYAVRCGGVIVGEIPGALYSKKDDRSEPATVVYYKRR